MSEPTCWPPDLPTDAYSPDLRSPRGFTVDSGGRIYIIKDGDLLEVHPGTGRATNHGPLLPSQTIERWALCDMPIDGG